MDMGHLILWIALPYMAIAILIMGIIWKYDSAYIQDQHHQGITVLEKIEAVIFGMLLVSIFVFVVNESFGSIWRWISSILFFQPSTTQLIHAGWDEKLFAILLVTFLSLLPFTGYVNLLFHLNKRIESIFVKLPLPYKTRANSFDGSTPKNEY